MICPDCAAEEHMGDWPIYRANCPGCTARLQRWLDVPGNNESVGAFSDTVPLVDGEGSEL